MDPIRIGRLVRILRHRAGLTQRELAQKAGFGRWKIIDLEAGDIDDLRVRDLSRCLSALDARLDLRAWYHGAAGDRLLDEGHARLVAAFVGILRRMGWEVRVEVSFAEYGERGSIDVLAWHARAQIVLVAEIKTELGWVEATLRTFDVKCRLVPVIVAKRFGWRPRHVGRILVLPEQRTARRAVERHAAAFDAALPARSRELRRWVRQPLGDVAGIWFLTDVGLADLTRNPSSIRRVRHARSRT